MNKYAPWLIAYMDLGKVVLFINSHDLKPGEFHIVPVGGSGYEVTLIYFDHDSQT